MYSSTLTFTSLSLLAILQTSTAEDYTSPQATTALANDRRGSFNKARAGIDLGSGTGSVFIFRGSTQSGNFNSEVIVSNDGNGNGVTVINGKTVGATTAATTSGSSAATTSGAAASAASTGSGAAQTSPTHNRAPRQTAGLVGAAAVAVGAAMVL